MHSHVFLRGYQRHGVALRGEIFGSGTSSENNCPLKARHESRWGYKFSRASVNTLSGFDVLVHLLVFKVFYSFHLFFFFSHPVSQMLENYFYVVQWKIPTI